MNKNTEAGILNSPPLKNIEFKRKNNDGTVTTLSLPDSKFTTPSLADEGQAAPESIEIKLVYGYMFTFRNDGLGAKDSVELVAIDDLRDANPGPVPLSETAIYRKRKRND